MQVSCRIFHIVNIIAYNYVSILSYFALYCLGISCNVVFANQK